MASLAFTFAIALYLAPYFDTVVGSLQPEPVVLYVTSAFQVIGEIAFISPWWWTLRGKPDPLIEAPDTRSTSLKGKIREFWKLSYVG
jgi:hypothetical protein